MLLIKRSEEIQTRMDEIRQQRVDLAKSLTDNFDDLENQTSIFLVRPIFSYQGRSGINVVCRKSIHYCCTKRFIELQYKNI